MNNFNELEPLRQIEHPDKGIMLGFERELQELESKVYNQMGKCSQKTIDLVQNAGMEFFNEGERLRRDTVGAVQYEISLILEIIDKSLKVDIQLIVELSVIVNKIYEYLDYLNKER